MRKFLKTLPYILAVPLYLVLFVLLTVIGHTLGVSGNGMTFSIPTTIVLLVVDLLITYHFKYKKLYKSQE
jgi:hypothetical protein